MLDNPDLVRSVAASIHRDDVRTISSFSQVNKTVHAALNVLRDRIRNDVLRTLDDTPCRKNDHAVAKTVIAACSFNLYKNIVHQKLPAQRFQTEEGIQQFSLTSAPIENGFNEQIYQVQTEDRTARDKLHQMLCAERDFRVNAYVALYQARSERFDVLVLEWEYTTPLAYQKAWDANLGDRAISAMIPTLANPGERWLGLAGILCDVFKEHTTIEILLRIYLGDENEYATFQLTSFQQHIVNKLQNEPHENLQFDFMLDIMFRTSEGADVPARNTIGEFTFNGLRNSVEIGPVYHYVLDNTQL